MRSLLIGVVLGGILAAQPVARAKSAIAEPSLHPSRAEIVFVSGGDLWTAPLAGGEAQLIVSHPARDYRPLWSPDGKRLAFASLRSGNGDIYVLDTATGDLKQLTFDDAAENLDGWSPDGEWIYFHASRQVQLTDLFRVRASGDADGGERRRDDDRVPGGSGGGREIGRVLGARDRLESMVAERALAPGRERDLAAAT